MIEERIEDEESELEALLAEKAVDGGELEDIDLIEAEPAEVEVEAPSVQAGKSKAEKAEDAAGDAEAEEAAPDEGAAAAPVAGGMFGNLFAERLKNALTKKRQEDSEKKPEEKDKE